VKRGTGGGRWTLGALAERQLTVVTGKGGVGKTTVAAALARGLAGGGCRVLLLEVDPRESAHHLLEIAPSGGAIVPVAPRLFLQNLRPRQVLDDLVRRQLRLEVLTRRILDSPVYQQFAEGAPGLEELAILGHALQLLEGEVGTDAPVIDQVVLDAPATGHGVSLLAAPRLVSEVIRGGPFGEMAARLAGFVAAPERCGVVVVAMAEEMPVQEAVELLEALDVRLDRRPEVVVVNALYPPVPAAAEGDPALLDLWRQRRELNERQRRRLVATWSGPCVDLPLLPLDRGGELVTALVRLLSGEELGG
jgi:anion-transporting  ArsA/GET3 family ATPase